MESFSTTYFWQKSVIKINKKAFIVENTRTDNKMKSDSRTTASVVHEYLLNDPAFFDIPRFIIHADTKSYAITMEWGNAPLESYIYFILFSFFLIKRFQILIIFGISHSFISIVLGNWKFFVLVFATNPLRVGKPL